MIVTLKLRVNQKKKTKQTHLSMYVWQVHPWKNKHKKKQKAYFIAESKMPYEKRSF